MYGMRGFSGGFGCFICEFCDKKGESRSPLVKDIRQDLSNTLTEKGLLRTRVGLNPGCPCGEETKGLPEELMDAPILS